MAAIWAPGHRTLIRTLTACAAVALITLGVGGAWANPPPGVGQPHNPWKVGRLLVEPRAGLADSDLDQIVERNGGQPLGRLPHLDVQVIQVPAGAEDAVAAALARNPHIKFAEKDLLLPPTAASNDPYFSWHLTTIQAPAAWGTAPGTGITVAVVDTGVDATEPDLAGQLVPGWDVVSGSAAPATSPINAHGTLVTGMVDALTNNGWGVASIAWSAKVMPVRVSDSNDGSAYTSDIANGIVWAADHGAQIANVSYDIGNGSTLSTAAQYLRNKGGIVVAAAGNDGVDPGLNDNPYVISVSATDSSDNLASFSNYGNYIDLAAPGVSLYSVGPSAQIYLVSGTSFSSPIVAAVGALVMAVNPALTPTEVESVLEQSADDLGAPGWDPEYGYGRVNADAAVQLAVTGVPTDTQPPTVSITSPANGATVSGLVGVNVSASDNQTVAKVALYAGSTLVATDTTAPFAFSWDSTTQADGSSVVLTAQAADAAGNVATSAPVTVTVQNTANTPPDTTPPTVSITSPANGATVSGTVSITAGASDNVLVVSLSLSIDGTQVNSVNGGAISYSWNTRKVSAGAHTISAVAVDEAGNAATATITVNLGSTATYNGNSGNSGKSGKTH